MPEGYDHYFAELCQRLRGLREKLGLSQEAVAEAAGITPRQYQNVEGGRTKSPGLKVMFGIARALGMDLGELLSK